jgi:hypothetical protein
MDLTVNEVEFRGGRPRFRLYDFAKDLHFLVGRRRWEGQTRVAGWRGCDGAQNRHGGHDERVEMPANKTQPMRGSCLPSAVPFFRPGDADCLEG